MPVAPRRRHRGLLPVGALAALTVACLLPGAASAASVPTPNACRYSYDQYYRDIPVTISGSATPSATPVSPGTTITVGGGSVSVQLPDNLARYGYVAGLLNAGDNTIPVRVWLALSATNTAEGSQVVGPIDLTAHTTISIDPNDEGRFSGATPFTYDAPALPQTTWTATGGDVVVRQAGPGALGSLPIGAVAGSVAIQATVKDGISFTMDCQPGRTLGVNPVDLAGATFAPAAIVWPFAGAAAGPALAPAGAVASTSLRPDRSGRVGLSIACADAATTCVGRASVRGAGTALTRVQPYQIPAGRTSVVRLTLTKAAAKLLARKRSSTVDVTLTPGQGDAATGRVVLRRR